MDPLKFYEIKGNWATLVLPINKDNSIDYVLLSHEIDLLISMGVDGIYSNGSAGEFYNQTEYEFDRCCEILADKCNSTNSNFQIGVGHMSPIISLERLKRVKKFRPGAVQVILPDWFSPTIQEATIFLRKMEEVAEGIGLVLYNPQHSKRNLNLQEIGILKKTIKGLIGVKVAGGDIAWYREMQKINHDISFFIPGHHLATGIKYGALGAYSNMACLNPLAAQKWYELVLNDSDKALELEKRINIFIENYISPLIRIEKFSNMAVDKFLVLLGGWMDLNPRLRWPYRSVDPTMVNRIRPRGEELIPEFFNVT